MRNNINYKDIEGIITPGEMELLIDSKASCATNANRAFSLFIFEINAVYSNSLTSDYDLNQMISKIIYKNIRRQDEFTIDSEGRFIILFYAFTPVSIYIPVSRILDKIRENLGEFVDINIGFTHCPSDGVDFSSIFYSLMESLAHSKDGCVDKVFKELSESDLPEDVKQSCLNIEKNKENRIKLNFLINQINKYSIYLKQHTSHVTKCAISLAQELNLGWSDIERIAIGAILHDIGYTLIPPVYMEQGRAKDKESLRILKLHPKFASEKLLKPMGIFAKYIPLVEDHHELLDGSGFPEGKKGHQIDIASQIISIADMYCTLYIEQSGVKTYELEDIIEIYNRNAGIKWNRELVTCFTSMISDVNIRHHILNAAY